MPSLLRGVGCLALLALLAACAGQAPQHSATQEAARYAAHARGNYTPPGPPEDPWGPYIREASKRFDVPEIWVRSVMRVESGGNEYQNGQLITSSAGAMGLMQVMPETYDELRGRYSLGDDPFDPHDNILAGTAYLREMYDIYGSPGFLAAYNAGPRRLDDYLSNNRPLPDETRRYVAMIGPNIVGVYPTNRSPAEDYAMNALPIDIPPGRAMAARCSWRAAAAAAVGRRRAARSRWRSCPNRRGRRLSRRRSNMPWCSPPSPPPSRGGFRIIPQAVAEPVPMHHSGSLDRAVGDPGRRLFERGPGACRGRHRARAGRGGTGGGAHPRRPVCTSRAGSCIARGSPACRATPRCRRASDSRMAARVAWCCRRSSQL